jgi:5-carboxymethyl-2-hydroxymuconate isomerase
MKIVSFETDGNTSFGIEKDGAIIDLAGRIDGATVAEDLLIPELQAKAAAIAATADGDVATTDVTLQIPVTNPEKILCIGINYANRNEEYGDLTPIQEYLIFKCLNGKEKIWQIKSTRQVVNVG